MSSLDDEFPGQAAAIERLKAANPRFAALTDREHALSREIAHVERAGALSDEQIKALKVERLGLLDEISLILRGGENAPSQARKAGRE
ncbi:MAG TPA: DUF465 domain-containing protein [Caulobacterales bacterium]|jgi:uncharacterized protein YdcH (DUF465 family)|nr:DUF465 domain-containing protein [Caulobacterales bacterium]